MDAAVMPAGMQTYNPFLTPSANSKLAQIMLDQQLGQQQEQQGLTPLDTNNRQVGGVGYRISPVEGLAKIAQALSGAYEQKQAIQDQQNLFNPQPTQDQAQAPLDAQAQDPNAQQGPTVNASALAQQLAGAQNPNLSGAGQSVMNDPVLANMAMRDPDDLSKIIATSRFAGYRPGESYVGANGQRMLVPTDMQQNLGAGNMASWQQNQSDPLTSGTINGQEGMYPASVLRAAAMGNQPPAPQPMAQPPANGTPMAAAPSGAMPPPASPQGAPAGSGMPSPMPPSPSQINPSAMANSPASASLASAIPASALTPAGGATMPAAPAYGKTVLTPQQQAALDVQKASAIANASKQGEDLEAAKKAADTVNSRFANSNAILDQMAVLAPQTSGGPQAEVMEPLHRMLNDDTSKANKSFENLAANQLTTALAPVIQGLGGRIDIPLLKAINEAESVSLEDSTKGKLATINNLKNLLQVNQQNAQNQVSNLAGQPITQNQSPMNNAPIVHWVMQNGKLVQAQ